MSKRIGVILILLALFLAAARPVFARSAAPEAGNNFVNLFPVALMLLLPIGLILLMSSVLPEEQAPAMAINLLLTWAAAALAYFGVGFAFHFGGIAQVSSEPELSGLYWEWYLLGQSVEWEITRLWGVIAWQGWALTGGAMTDRVFQLFAGHLSLVGLAALLPAGILLRRGRGGMAMLMGLFTGALLYPVGGNWLWGGGWLFHLGVSLGWGHGLVDFGGASVIFGAGSLAALIALLLFKAPIAEDRQNEPEEVVVLVPTDTRLTVYHPEAGEPTEEGLGPVTPMPSAYLPILGMLGAGLMLLGWFGLAAGDHTPAAVNFSPAQAAVNGLLAALSAALATAGYCRFTTGRINVLMISRGLVAGLVVAVAGAPFMPPWILVAAGLVMGLLLPLLTYLFNQGLRLADEPGILATYGVSAIISLLLVALFADGRAGWGWNGVGLAEYKGVAGQGVSGLVVAPGYVSDWPGQLQAQLLGAGAIALLAAGLSFLLLQTIKVGQKSWARSGLELIRPSLPFAGRSKKSVSSPSFPEEGETAFQSREEG
ncbi:MAG: hypothetical protein JW953_19075 [Anaerolineae bacterium]|nr:hypothetical protein [Anaerolineae bacterium]